MSVKIESVRGELSEDYTRNRDRTYPKINDPNETVEKVGAKM